MTKYISVLLFSLFFFLGQAQDSTKIGQKELISIPGIDALDLEQIQINEDTLGLLAYLIVNDSLAEDRFLGCHQFIPKLVKTLKYKNSFNYPFEQLKTISIQYPADSSFRIFTWQLFVDNDTYKYFGAIQMNTSDLKLYPLLSRPDSVEAPEFEILTNKEWFGALCYNIKDFDTAEGKKYIIFGYQHHNFYAKRKVLDVLSFKDDKPTFGAPVFVRQDENDVHPPTKNRVILDYYAGAGVRLNYDEVHEVILFDHLIEVVDPSGLKMLPDGSYEGYKYEEGKWKHVVKLFHQISDEPPNLDNKANEKGQSKDILGRAK